jgi:spermidine synthase
MIDIDGEVVAACREHLPLHHRGAFDDPRLHLQHIDAVAFLHEGVADDERYDVVVSDMTDPVEDGPATFCFTREYFAAVSDVLTDAGVLVVQAGPVSPVEISLHAKVIRTLRAAFPYVDPYSIDAPCYSRPLGFVLASRTPIRERLTAVRTAAQLDALPGRTDWLTAIGLEGRLDPPPYLLRAVAARTDIYTDAAPPATGHSAGWES